MWSEHRSQAMGTTVSIVGPVGYERVLEQATRRIADLERRWSRFLPTSELSRLNDSPARPVIVSTETFDVIALAVDAWRSTGGRFDPTILAALVEQGYDRSFDDLDPVVAANGESRRAPTPAGIGLDDTLNAVVLPPGVTIDLGGIGKGAAADLVVSEARGSGIPGIAVNIGGDARVWGEGPSEGRWRVVLRCPGGADARAIDLVEGAGCTSSKLRRRWTNRRGPAHHLIDPARGRPVETDVASVGVAAATAAQAEVVAKVALIGGVASALELLETLGLDGAVVSDRGAILDTGRPLCPCDVDGNPLKPVVPADGRDRD